MKSDQLRRERDIKRTEMSNTESQEIIIKGSDIPTDEEKTTPSNNISQNTGSSGDPDDDPNPKDDD